MDVGSEQEENTARASETVERLKALLSPAELLATPQDCERYASDQSGLEGALPLAVLRPASVETLSRAMALCAEAGIAMIPQGGRTGLSAGGCAVAGSVVLSSERMTGVIEVDPDAMTLTAWAGTPLQVVQEAARAHGLDYPVDIGARGTATLGGTIATNAGGIRVLRNGMTRQNVLGLEAVLADGRVVSRLGKLVKDNAGLDLKQLFIGSEGILGVITRAVVQLRPYAPQSALALLALPDHAAALRCLASARSRFAERLSAFEGMWPDYWTFVCHRTSLTRSPFSGEHGFYVLIEVEVPTDGADDTLERWFEDLFEAGLVEDGVLAQSLAEMNGLWRIREAVGDVDADFGPHINFDLGIAPSRLGLFCDACDAILADTDGVTGTLKVGHIGDGNVHLLVAHEEDDAAAEEIERRVYGLVSQWDGTVTAEHGIGRIKRAWLRCSRSQEEIALIRMIKAQLDPKGLLNPGVMIEAG